MAKKFVIVEIDATNNHCNNDCQWMNNGPNYTESIPLSYCKLFNQNLVWDNRKIENGYKRLKLCKMGSA